MLYPSVLLSYVFTNLQKPKNWKVPQDDIPYTEVVSFDISFSTTSCGVGVIHFYAENTFIRALYRFHIYYTVRRILWRLGVLLSAAPNFDPLKTNIDCAALEKVNQEFSVDVDSSLQSWAFNYDPRHLLQDGKTDDYYYIHQFPGQIPELTDSLTAAGLKAISEPICAYTVCVLSAQLSAWSTIVGTNTAALDVQAEFVNALEAHLKRPINFLLTLLDIKVFYLMPHLISILLLHQIYISYHKV